MVKSLKKEIKVIAKHSSVYGLANILNRIISFIMLPIYTRYLTTSDYGILQILYFVYTLVSIVLSMGISDAMSRFYFDSDKTKERNKVVSTTIIGFGSLSVILSLFLLNLTKFASIEIFDSIDYKNLFVILFLTLGVEFTVQTGFAYFRVVKQSFRLMIFSLTQLFFTISLNILFLVYMKMGVEGILLSTLIINGLIGIIMIISILIAVGSKFSFPLYWSMIKFGLPLIPSNIANYLMIASDRYFIKDYVSLSETGLYSLGYKIGSVISNFITSPFTQIWFPRRFEHFNKEDSELIFARIFTYFASIITLGALFISLMAQDILKIMTTKPFWPAYQVVSIIALAHIFHSFYYHFTIGISYKKKTVYYMYINIISGVTNLVLNYFLIRRYGIWGAAYATLTTYILRDILVYYFSNKLYPIIFEKMRIAKILIVAIFIYFVGLHLESPSVIIDLLLKTAVIIFYPILLYFLRFFNPDEIKIITEYYHKLKDRIGLSANK